LDLPFLPEAAHAQVEAAGWTQLPAADHPVYPGQRRNPLEREYSVEEQLATYEVLPPWQG
jgi:hypothetical protein